MTDIKIVKKANHLRILKTMTNSKTDEIISRICELQLVLTTKIIEGRLTDYRPREGDEDQPLRDELLKLRRRVGIIK